MSTLGDPWFGLPFCAGGFHVALMFAVLVPEIISFRLGGEVFGVKYCFAFTCVSVWLLCFFEVPSLLFF